MEVGTDDRQGDVDHRPVEEDDARAENAGDQREAFMGGRNRRNRGACGVRGHLSSLTDGATRPAAAASVLPGPGLVRGPVSRPPKARRRPRVSYSLPVLAQSSRGLWIGVSVRSTWSRTFSKRGGSTSFSPRCAGSSSVEKPGPFVAISNSTPLGSRK